MICRKKMRQPERNRQAQLGRGHVARIAWHDVRVVGEQARRDHHMAIGDQRDLELARKNLTTYFGRVLPAVRDIDVTNLSAPGMGFSNETLLVDLSYTQDGGRRDEKLVIRVKPKAQVFPEYDLRRQYTVMQMLEPTDVPVPHMRWFEEAPDTLGASFYVMGRIDGVVPPDYPPYHVAGCCTEMTPASRAALWWDGLDKLSRIHKLDWRGLGFDFLARPDLGATPLAQQLEYYRRYLDWAAAGRPQPTVEAALAWLLSHQPADEPTGLCWGDSRVGNMIFANDRCVAVLDWEMVTLGNPEQDLGWWLFLDWHHSGGIGVERLAGFPSREETVARYETLTGRTVRSLHYYEVFAAFRFAVVMIRIAQLVREAGLPAPDDMATNNTCTQGLARLLDLPPPR
jgi:aminoglycoside phosphotransferase (APT) family kinase protein